MTSIVERILSEAASDGDNLRTFLLKNELVAPQLAEYLASVSHQYGFAGQLDAARSAGIAAATIWELGGDMESAWGARCNVANVLLQSADSVAEYEALRQFIRETIEKFAQLCTSDALLFLSHVIAADAHFWESQLCDGQKRTSLAIAGGWQLTQIPMKMWKAPSEQKLASTIQALSMVLWRSIGQRSRDEVDDVLQGLATATQQCISIDVEFPGDEAKTEHVRKLLATLTCMHGDRSHAVERWSLVLQRPVNEREYLTWLNAKFPMYRSVNRNTVDRAVQFEAAALRAFFRIGLEGYRDFFRSPGGRHWAANVADQITGELLWDDLLSSLLSNGEYFDAIERASARVLLDEIQGQYRAPPNELEESKMHEREALAVYGRKLTMANYESEDRKLTTQIRSKYANFVLVGAGASDTVEKELSPLEERYALLDAGFRSSANVSSSEDLAASLLDDELLLYFFVIAAERHPAKELVVAAISKSERIIQPISLKGMPGWNQGGSHAFGVLSKHDTNRDVARGMERIEWHDSSSLGLYVQRFRQAIIYGDLQGADNFSQEFTRVLLKRLYDEGVNPSRYKRWIIVPSRVLNYVPFAALRAPDGKYLVEHVSIVTCPSGSIWLELVKRTRQPETRSLAVLANPMLDRNIWDDLPEAELEAEKLAKSLGGGWQISVEKGAAANIDAVRAQFANANVIHIATHGEFPEDDAFRSHALMLSPTAEHDGRLDAMAISRLELRNCALVTLSVCNGGLYRFGAGNEPFGIVRSLLVAGAQNVLGALWPVEDLPTRLFIASFYENLFDKSASEAAQAACIMAIRNGSPLSQWAGFMLCGPGRLQLTR